MYELVLESYDKNSGVQSALKTSRVTIIVNGFLTLSKVAFVGVYEEWNVDMSFDYQKVTKFSMPTELDGHLIFDGDRMKL